jgi:hypothetical protein
MQILGTDNALYEGKVFAYKGLSVGFSLDVDGVDVTTELNAKANKGATYTKTEVDTAITNIELTPRPQRQDHKDRKVVKEPKGRLDHKGRKGIQELIHNCHHRGDSQHHEFRHNQ